MATVADSKSKSFLSSLVVRPVRAQEKERWNAVMREHHYLGFKSLVGNSLRYVATWEGAWVALIGWGCSALHCKPRDQWMGWSELIKYQRLKFIANNHRFLILDDFRQPNVASKVLSLNLKRLSSDWQRIHGHPILIAETFVDAQRFQGTCYKASNWLCLGNTQGYGKRGQKYVYHGQPKRYWLIELQRYARQHLVRPILPTTLEPTMTKKRLNSNQLDELRLLLGKLPDPRRSSGRLHPFRSVVGMAICALLGGARGYTALGEWAQACTQSQLKRFGAYFDQNKQCFIAPSESCIRRTLQAADVGLISQAISRWILSVTGHKNKVIAIDGKTLRGTSRDNNEQVHLLSAYLQGEGVVIAQEEVGSHTQEPSVVSDLLEGLPVEGNIITADALHTKKPIADLIVKKKQITY